MKTILLVHKHFLNWGGAESFLLEEFNHFSNIDSNTEMFIVKMSSQAKKKHLNKINNRERVSIFSSNYVVAFIRLFLFLLKRKKSHHVICASGHIEVGVICRMLNIDYSLHLHHPSFMTMLDTDIYRLRKNKIFDKLSTTYESGKLIVDRRNKLKLIQLLLYRLKSIPSISSIKKARHRFVLSRYHKYEKKLLYNINCQAVNAAFSKDQLNKDRPHRTKYFKGGTLRLLSICRLVSNKRVVSAIQCVEYLNKVQCLDQQVMLTVVGTGDQYNYLNDYVKSRNINNIHFHGFAEHHEIDDLINSHDIFFALDIGDFKLNMHEALLMHVPVICSQETEVSDKLLKTNYVEKTDLNAKCLSDSVGKIYTNYTNELFKPELLEEYLESMNWQDYFDNLYKLVQS